MRIKIPLQRQDGRLIPVMNTELTNFPGERWKDIPEFDGYQVSNYGRVKSLSRYIYDKNGIQYSMKEKIRKLILRQQNEGISIQIGLRKDNKPYSFIVPRLVYCLFVATFDLYDHTKIVIKKNGDYLNCYYKNLKLTSVSKNILEGYATKGRRSGFDNRRIAINQYDTNGKFIQTFNSVKEAAKKIGASVTAVCEAAHSIHYRCKEFYWRYGEPLPSIDVSQFNAAREQLRNWKKPVQKLSANGKILKTYGSINAAANALAIDKTVIRRVCKNSIQKVNGYHLQYAFIS